MLCEQRHIWARRAVPFLFLIAGLTASLVCTPVWAQGATAPPPHLDSGDTAWMLTSARLVLLMTIPGLALFYGGMVRVKNLLSVMMQCFAIAALVTVLWLFYG
jgi:Amt family ammonium transporter